MIEIISLILILIEGSIPTQLTYGIVAGAYTTYLAGKKEMKSVFLSFFVMLLLSLQSINIFENVIFVITYSLVFYMLFLYLEFRKGNMPFVALVQTGLWFLILKKSFEIKEAVFIYGLYLVLDIIYAVIKRKFSGITTGVAR